MPDSYRFELVQRGTVVDTHDLLSQMRVIVGSVRVTAQGSRKLWTCTLGKADTAANIRTAVNDLRTFLRTAVEYATSSNTLYECWFRWQTEGEEAKRALIYSYTLEPIDNDVEDMHLEANAARYLLSFLCEAAYEEVSAQPSSKTAVSTVGGSFDLTGTITGGDTAGRIEKLIIKPRMASVNLYKAWVGVRPPRYGIGNPLTIGFNPVLNLTLQNFANGLLYPTYISYLAGGYDGYYMRDNFGEGTDLAVKFSYGVNVEPYIGDYLVLMLARVTGTTICNARISTSLGGYGTGAYDRPVAVNSTQYIQDTAWRYYEMGLISIPGGRAGHIQSLASFNVNIESGRISGSGNLDIDCLVLIPAESYFTWDQAEFGKTASTAGNVANAYIYTNPDGSVEGVVVNTSGAAAGTDGYAEQLATLGTPGGGWWYPYDGGCLVIAAERETGAVYTDAVDIDIYIKRRWELYRT